MPDKLGATHPQIAEVLAGETPITKRSFSAYGEEAFFSRLAEYDSKHVVLIGIETHICIYQTAIDLLAAGYKVTVIADAVSSRTESNKQIGLGMLRDAGAQLLSTEALLFSVLRTAAHPKFKEIAKLVK